MKIAIFGGTFDPIHEGHIKIIEELIKLNMDKIIVIPTNVKYYKKNQPMLSYNERVEQCNLYLSKYNNVEVSNIEADMNDNEGFADTLLKLKNIYPKDELFTVIGSDSFNSIKSWRRYQIILNLSKLIVATRSGYQIDSNIDLDYIKMDINVDVSSTDIRNKLKGE